ncbi:hypothetical protein ACFY8K_02730 [Streptomyces misionensis]|uniref:hypothetical protein n=1 Tax=Streptomyces TaxID=1883 RepID=UPI0015D62723|nr:MULTISPECIES: hypothetical protein [unclassified Streptomyces]QLJ03510.1 hypothetical protein HZZ00_22670 [Streptomyces sp. NEAU-sy36]
MAGGDDFYSKDRPEHPRMAEDRPRGGGPEDRPSTGHRHALIWFVVAVVVILVLFFIFI